MSMSELKDLLVIYLRQASEQAAEQEQLITDMAYSLEMDSPGIVKDGYTPEKGFLSETLAELADEIEGMDEGDADTCEAQEATTISEAQ